MRINISSYGNYSNNYGTNSMRVTIGSLTLYFSYETVIAFRDGENGLQVIQNRWGPTTGKHLNLIDGGNISKRLPEKEFNEMLKRTLIAHNLEV